MSIWQGYRRLLGAAAHRLGGGKPTSCRDAVPKAEIAELLGPSPVVVDAGAHVGDDTREMSLLWPEGQIHAFEPVPHLFDRLVANVNELANVQCYNLALAAAPGTRTMFLSSGRSDGSSSLLEPAGHLTEHPDVRFDDQTVVRMTSLDAWAGEHSIERVDLLWLDLQGYELEALKGADRTLADVQVIHTEVSLKEMYRGAPLYSELRAWLKARGFSVLLEELPWPDMGNVLFVRCPERTGSGLRPGQQQ